MDDDMKKAVERLRASKQAWEQDDKTAGHNDGRAWAKDDAEYAWLHRLAESPVEIDPLDTLLSAVDPDDELTREEQLEICFGNENSSEPTDAYIEAFVAGAVEFFKQVRDQI
jgi:hypothetical protein